MEKKTEEVFASISKTKRLTLTRDNGTEFGDYDRTLEEATGMKVYRAAPYHSWERGTNENWNGLLRQFFPTLRGAAQNPAARPGAQVEPGRNLGLIL